MSLVFRTKAWKGLAPLPWEIPPLTISKLPVMMKYRDWGISEYSYYKLISPPNDYDFVQIPFNSTSDAQAAIDERIDHPERFDPLTWKKLSRLLPDESEPESDSKSVDKGGFKYL